VSDPAWTIRIVSIAREEVISMVRKVPLARPKAREFKDLTSPNTIKKIWEDAASVVKDEAPAVRNRRVHTKPRSA